MKNYRIPLLAAAMLVGLFLTAKAATTVTVQVATKSGVTITRTSTGLVASGLGTYYKFRNDGQTFLLFEKTGAGTASIDIGPGTTWNGLQVSSLSVSIPATNGDKVIGPLPPRLFNDGNGDVTFGITNTVGLSMAVIKL